MLSTLEQLEQEIALFRKNVSDSNQLMLSLQKVIAAMQKQTDANASVTGVLQELPDQIRAASEQQELALMQELQQANLSAGEKQAEQYKAMLQKIAAYNKQAESLKACVQKSTEELSEFQTSLVHAIQSGNAELRETIATQVHAQLTNVEQKLMQYTTSEQGLYLEIGGIKTMQQQMGAALSEVQQQTAGMEQLVKNESRRQMQEMERHSEQLSHQIQERDKTERNRFRILLILMGAILILMLFLLVFHPGTGDTGTTRAVQMLPEGLHAIGSPELSLQIPADYIGELADGLPEGEGSYEWADGARFEGNWKAGKANGEGTFTCAAYQLVGEFADNKLVNGTQTVLGEDASVTFPIRSGDVDYQNVEVRFPDETVYYGEWNSGIQGAGKADFKNGDSYQGHFENGMMNGEGSYSWKNGASYQGSWLDNQMNGEGTYYYSQDNDRYIAGAFEANQPVGELRYMYRGHAYTTTWKDGQCTRITY